MQILDNKIIAFIKVKSKTFIIAAKNQTTKAIMKKAAHIVKLVWIGIFSLNV